MDRVRNAYTALPGARRGSLYATSGGAQKGTTGDTVHQFNHDVQLLDEWIGGILNDTNKFYATTDSQTLLNISAQYDVCFKELVRQAATLSPLLAR